MAVFVVPSLAQPDEGGPPCKRGMFWEELKLTDDQATQLKLLKVDTQKDHILHFAEVKKVREKIKAELLKEKPSKSALTGFSKELGKLHTALSEKRMERFLKTKEILNKEQFEKLLSKEMLKEGRKHMKHFKHKCKGECNCKHKGKGECKGKH
jgi:Spy/CpxP family protein refolding chaperone